jgi:hypothetical protein
MPLPLMGKNVALGFNTGSLLAAALGDAELTVTLPAAKMLLTIVSHDCEFNEAKRNKLLVARLQAPQGNLTDEQREGLRASNDVEARAAAELPVDAVDHFLFSPLPGVFANEQVAAFTTITPLPMKMADDLYSVKRAELTHENRVLFRKKLAWFVGRGGEDIPEDEKIDAPTPAELEERMRAT